jgi:hypothetical protein
LDAGHVEPGFPTHSGAEVSEGEPTPYTSTNTLYLVNPEGGRYALTSFPPTDGGAPYLVDWSGDGSRAPSSESHWRRRDAPISIASQSIGWPQIGVHPQTGDTRNGVISHGCLTVVPTT